MNNPSQRVKYTSRIESAGDKPQFVVIAEDDPTNPIISQSPSVAWRTVLRRVMSKDGSSDSGRNISVSGRLRFGLAHPAVATLIRELPGAEKFKNHDSQDLSPSSPRKRKNVTGDSSSSSDSDEQESPLDSPDRKSVV